jgi:iron complex outermembrane receptor protein
VYSPTSNTSLFFSYVRSFSPSDPTVVSKAGTPFQPQHAEQYEAGIKNSAFGGRLATTIALYRIRQDNVLTADPADPRFSVQTGVQRSKGVDVDTVGRIKSGWNVWAAYEFDQAQVVQDNSFPIGALLTEAPRHSGNIWTAYEIQHGPAHGLGLGAGVYATTFKFGDLLNSYLLPGYARLECTAYYSFHSNEKTSWRFAVNVKNALDKSYYEASTGGFARAGSPLAVYSSMRFTWF